MNLDNGLTPAPGTPWAREFLRLLAARAAPPLRRAHAESLARDPDCAFLAAAQFANAALPGEHSSTQVALARELGKELNEAASAILADWPETAGLPPDEAENLAFMAAIKEIR